jgi:hypothetical protein
MKRNQSIQYKAVFLLIVFSLSTVVGFACAIGMDMKFNQDHHKNGGHLHAEGVKADHHEKPHSHDDQTKHINKLSDNTQEKKKDDCCKDEVAQIEKTDKRVPQPFNYNFQPLFITITLISTLNLDALASDQHTPSNRHFVRNHHPPQVDIRIAIQSFLI